MNYYCIINIIIIIILIIYGIQIIKLKEINKNHRKRYEHFSKCSCIDSGTQTIMQNLIDSTGTLQCKNLIVTGQLNVGSDTFINDAVGIQTNNVTTTQNMTIGGNMSIAGNTQMTGTLNPQVDFK